jgi:hypothetical protein
MMGKKKWAEMKHACGMLLRKTGQFLAVFGLGLFNEMLNDISGFHKVDSVFGKLNKRGDLPKYPLCFSNK